MRKLVATSVLLAIFSLVQCDDVASDVVQDPFAHEVKFIDKIRSIEKSGESRIVGGDEVTPHYLPHQAALFITKMNGQDFCGGSLISEIWVLTSASCLTGASSVMVILGAHNLSEAESTQQRINSTVFRIHPQWDPTSLQNDVALIRLPYAAKLNTNVSPICMAPSYVEFYDGVGWNDNVTASGWGKTTQTGPNTTTSILRSVTTPTITIKECNETHGFITDGMMCTNTTGGQGTCTGDKGGPLMRDKSPNGAPNQRQCLVGISSFVFDSTCQAGYPAVFTRVYYYVDNFITNETGILPCRECSGTMIIPSAIILLCSLIFLRFTNLF